MAYLDDNGLLYFWQALKTLLAGKEDSLPSQTGNSGKYLTTNGSAMSWAAVDALPSQTGKNGKYLKTNGSAASWEDAPDISGKLDKSGGTMTGDLTLAGAPTSNLHAATKAYVDASYTIAGKRSGTSLGQNATAEGDSVTASGDASHAEGYYAESTGDYSHAENQYSSASGQGSHAEGYMTSATRRSQHVFGECNIADSGGSGATSRGTYVEIVGNGSDQYDRSNARTLDWSGNEVLAGKLTVGAAPTNNMDVTTKQYVDGAISSAVSGTTMFKGEVNSNTTISSSSYVTGWYWVVGTAGTYVGQTCEVGDMIFAIEDKGSSYSADDFTVIQANLNIVAITNAEIDAIMAS